jgi:hypothetical protein
MEETVDPLDFINFQACKCDDCQERKRNYEYGPLRNPAENGFDFGSPQGITVE